MRSDRFLINSAVWRRKPESSTRSYSSRMISSRVPVTPVSRSDASRALTGPFGRRLSNVRPFSASDELGGVSRSEEHTSELQSLMRISYAVFCLIKKKIHHNGDTPLNHATGQLP